MARLYIDNKTLVNDTFGIISALQMKATPTDLICPG